MTASLTVRDAITGEPATVRPHRHWVCVGYDRNEDIYLTPTAARQLAAQLLDAADTITTTEGTAPPPTASPPGNPYPSTERTPE